MACKTDPKIKWHETGLVPTANLAGWWQYEAGVSSDGLVKDYSGGGRSLLCKTSNKPALQSDVYNGQSAWYFNGSTTDPLVNETSFSIPPVYVLTIAAAEGSAFNEYRGLISPNTTGTDMLMSNNTGTTFYDFSYSNYVYRKNGTVFAAASQQAPMNGVPAALEMTLTTGIALDGFRVGKHRNTAGRIWKGWWFETLAYTAVPTGNALLRLMLYVNLKYGLRPFGVPFYFPSDDLLDFRRARFYAEPPMYEAITDTYEYEDGGRTFNEVATCAPRRWEYEYQNVDPATVPIFDEFYNQARLANAFKFIDKYGTVWDNVHVESYSRSHDAHKSWMNTITFSLIKYPS